jgi:hypothetical protein
VIGSGGRGTGGVTGYGGVTGFGGVTGTGGMTGYGGATGMGGTTTPPNAGTVMTIANGQAHGAMTGSGWIAFGPLDLVTDPTCKSPAGALVSGVSCDETIWSSPSAYCVAGFIPAVPPDPTTSDWNNNWGIQIGINATPVAGGVLGQSFSAMAVSITGSPLTGLRALVHRKGDPETTSFCATIFADASYAFSQFSTTCWDAASPGTALAAADVSNIDKIGVQVSSTVGSSITVPGLCFEGITFTK